jgi:hypothetical protein
MSILRKTVCWIAAATAAVNAGAQENSLSDVPYRWRPVRIIDGGVMPGLYFHPAVPGLMYIRGNVGGAYRRDPGAAEWMPLTDWLGGQPPESNWVGIESIAVDPTEPNRVYLAAGIGLDTGYANGAILVSVDRGRSFRAVPLPFKLGANDLLHGQQSGERLAVDPFHPERLLLGTHTNGLWTSGDHGLTWHPQSGLTGATPDLVGVVFVRFDPHREGLVYAGLYTGGLFVSNDGGQSWQRVASQPDRLPNGDVARPMRSALGPDGILYITYSNEAGLAAINAGAVYKLDTASGLWRAITPPEEVAGTHYGYCAVAADARRPGTVMVGTWNRWWPGDDIFRSTDGGMHWTSLLRHSVRDTSPSPFLDDFPAPTFGIWNASFEIDPFDSDHAIYDGGDTVWETHDLTAMDRDQTTHWKIGARGIEEMVIHGVISPPEGTHLISIMADSGGFRHDDFDVSTHPFTHPYMVEVASLDFAAKHPEIMLRAGELDYKGNIAAAISRDGGKSWTPLSGLPPGAGIAPAIEGYAATVAVSADGAHLLWAPGDAMPAYYADDQWHSSRGAHQACVLSRTASIRCESTASIRRAAVFLPVPTAASTLWSRPRGCLASPARRAGACERISRRFRAAPVIFGFLSKPGSITRPTAVQAFGNLPLSRARH